MAEFVSDSTKCSASPDQADILETIQNAAGDWQKQGYPTALAEVRDMANVGRALMTAIADNAGSPPLKGWHPADCPSEIVADLLNMLDDAARAGPPAMDREAVESMVRISRDQYPEIIQAARWMDEDNGTPHFQPGVGFIIDDPEGLTVPARWVEYLPTIEAALVGLDHERPHPEDVDTLAWLIREDKEPTLYESAAHCFVSGEHTPVTIMANSSRELWIANRFFNERFEGWVFDPAADYPTDALSTLSADAIRQGEGDLRNAIRNEVINTPETADFMAGVPLEAAHQRDRWGADHDAGKAPLDWFWLIGYLAQKAADAAMRGDSEKAKHHTISTAAALANWHAALSGADNRMRPGIATPASHASDGGEA